MDNHHFFTKQPNFISREYFPLKTAEVKLMRLNFKWLLLTFQSLVHNVQSHASRSCRFGS